MHSTGNAYWVTARRALAKLQDQMLDHPAIGMIDLGEDPENKDLERPVLRIHIRRHRSTSLPDIPAEVDGIPVRLIYADYQLE